MLAGSQAVAVAERRLAPADLRGHASAPPRSSPRSITSPSGSSRRISPLGQQIWPDAIVSIDHVREQRRRVQRAAAAALALPRRGAGREPVHRVLRIPVRHDVVPPGAHRDDPRRRALQRRRPARPGLRRRLHRLPLVAGVQRRRQLHRHRDHRAARAQLPAVADDPRRPRHRHERRRRRGRVCRVSTSGSPRRGTSRDTPRGR